jgi:preprotein translocase subunit YajC
MDTSTLLQFLPIVILVVFVYFVVIRPQRKQNQQTQSMLDTMKIGDEVMTAGGFYGIIYAIDEENLVLEMLPDFNKAMIRKASIVKVITAETAAEEGKAAEAEEPKEELNEKTDDAAVTDAEYTEVTDDAEKTDEEAAKEEK